MGMSRPAVESTLFRARRRLTEEYDDIVSGARCQRIQGIIVTAVETRLGTRDTRRLARHLSHCQPCRREALAAGLDRELFARPTVRERVATKVAGILPFPIFAKFRRERRGGRAPPPSGRGAAFMQHLPMLSDHLQSGWGKAAAGAAVLVAGVGAGVGVKQVTSSRRRRRRSRSQAAQPAATKPRRPAGGDDAARRRRPPAAEQAATLARQPRDLRRVATRRTRKTPSRAADRGAASGRRRRRRRPQPTGRATRPDDGRGAESDSGSSPRSHDVRRSRAAARKPSTKQRRQVTQPVKDAVRQTDRQRRTTVDQTTDAVNETHPAGHRARVNETTQADDADRRRRRARASPATVRSADAVDKVTDVVDDVVDGRQGRRRRPWAGTVDTGRTYGHRRTGVLGAGG